MTKAELKIFRDEAIELKMQYSALSDARYAFDRAIAAINAYLNGDKTAKKYAIERIDRCYDMGL
jgi:hypothetical protein